MSIKNLLMTLVTAITFCCGCISCSNGLTKQDDSDAIVELTPEFIEKVQQYNQLAPFSEGRAAVRRGDKWGYINTKGEEVIECQFDRAEEYHEGITQVVKDDKPYYLNRDGKILFYGEGGKFSEGLALLDDGRVVNQKGEEVFKVELYTMAYSMSRVPNTSYYTEFPYFIDGVITVWGNEDPKSYDVNGKEVPLREIPDKIRRYKEFTDDVDYDSFNTGNHTGLKDENGKTVITPQYAEISDVSNGVALVAFRENDAYYFGLDEQGTGLKATEGFMEEYTPRYYAYADLNGNTTFSEKVLSHIEEANKIGRQRWETMMDNCKRKREEGTKVYVNIDIENDDNGNLVELEGNYKVGSLYNQSLIATDKIQVPEGKVWVYESTIREGSAFFSGSNLYTIDRYDSNGNQTWSEYEPWNYKKKLRGLHGKSTAPLSQRYVIDGGDYVIISAQRGANRGRHSLKVEFRELDRDYYREKCGYDF